MPGFFTEQQGKMRQELLIGIEKARQMSTVPLHSREFIELAFVASGNALHHHTGRDGKNRFDGLIQGICSRSGLESCTAMSIAAAWCFTTSVCR